MSGWQESEQGERPAEEDWQEVGRELPHPLPEAPDNVDTVPGWLWALAAGSVIACLGGGALGVAGLALIGASGGGAALPLGCGGVLALDGIGLGVYTLPLLLAALNAARSRRS